MDTDPNNLTLKEIIPTLSTYKCKDEIRQNYPVPKIIVPGKETEKYLNDGKSAMHTPGQFYKLNHACYHCDFAVEKQENCETLWTHKCLQPTGLLLMKK